MEGSLGVGGLDWDHICGSKSRIGLIISGSGVRTPQLSGGGIQKRPSPANPDQKRVRTFFSAEKNPEKKFGGRKIKCWGLSETVFAGFPGHGESI